jgi:hypothetical protein
VTVYRYSEYVRVHVDDAGVHFSFNVQDDDEEVVGKNTTSTTLAAAEDIPLCVGCHFGGSIGWREGIQGMLYHESGGSIDVDSLLEAQPVVSCDGVPVAGAAVEVTTSDEQTPRWGCVYKLQFSGSLQVHGLNPCTRTAIS